MSQPAATPVGDHAPLFEVRLHALSPFSPLVNGGLVAAVLFGSYVLMALHYGEDLVLVTEAGLSISQAAWNAFVLSLVFAAAVTMPGLGRSQWEQVLPDLQATLDADGQSLARAIAIGPAKARVGRALTAFAVGAVGGGIFTLWILGGLGAGLTESVESIRLWFVLVQPILFGLGARAAVQLGDDDKDMARLVKDHMQIDFVRIEALQVYGQLALRGALYWLVMAAIILLFFVSSDSILISAGPLIVAIAAGVFAFTSTMLPVVTKATAARNEKLVEVRAAIAAEGERALAGQAPATPLSELTAYESWLEKRPVWPISAPITRRFALYGLIPVLAWFGAAAAELVLEAFAG